MEVIGRLNNFFETGSEGVYWAIQKAAIGFQQGSSYDALFYLEEGDYLEVYDINELYVHGKHKVIWSGVIKKDLKSHMSTRPTNPEIKQQNILGYWVHWLQQDFENHEQWCWLFVLDYPAKLVRDDTTRLR